jgi:outer membrane lipoprotein-sorting protein
MSFSFSRSGKLPILPAILAFALFVPAVVAQDYARQAPGGARGNAYVAQAPAQANQQKPQYEVAERSAPVGAERARQILAQRSPNEHPLMPCLRWAYDGIDDIERIQDYSARMVKRERINGKVGEYESMFVKVRHRPFSVYMYFLGPEKKKGQEVIYSEAANDGKMLAHGVGIQKMFGTVSLDPTGQIAMNDNRYPITELGILTLVRRLVEVGEEDAKYGECEVKFYPGAKIEDRVCTCIQIIHPKPRRNFRFHVARIYVDDELNLPIRYESYDWPEVEGGRPQLLEEYTYLDLKLNNGFTDADFDVRNPNYQFNSK